MSAATYHFARIEMSESEHSDPSDPGLSRAQILKALESLSDHLAQQDIRFLIRHLGLRSPQEVLDLVAMYYPVGRIPVKTQYLVDGLFEEGLV